MSLTRCCSSVSRKCRLLSTVTRLIYSKSDSTEGICLESQSSREHWVRRFFFAVGPISTLGLVGDSGRTVRSLSAASKPRITQRTTRNTPSIQVEGAEHIFRVREFRFLLGKICVAHSVAHSFIFLLCCHYRLRMESRPRARGGIASIGEVLCTSLPSETCVNQKRPGRG